MNVKMFVADNELYDTLTENLPFQDIRGTEGVSVWCAKNGTFVLKPTTRGVYIVFNGRREIFLKTFWHHQIDWEQVTILYARSSMPEKEMIISHHDQDYLVRINLLEKEARYVSK